jgi:hypothetical protein
VPPLPGRGNPAEQSCESNYRQEQLPFGIPDVVLASGKPNNGRVLVVLGPVSFPPCRESDQDAGHNATKEHILDADLGDNRIQNERQARRKQQT